jgi:hypothetical protein
MSEDKWTKKDTAKETCDSGKKVSAAFHDARDDAASSGDLAERNTSKVSDSPEGKALHKTLVEKGAVSGKLGK